MIRIAVGADKFKEQAAIMDALDRAITEMRITEEADDNARKRLFELIRMAKERGVRTGDIMDMTGYSRQRIWQICEEKDTPSPA